MADNNQVSEGQVNVKDVLVGDQLWMVDSELTDKLSECGEWSEDHNKDDYTEVMAGCVSVCISRVVILRDDNTDSLLAVPLHPMDFDKDNFSVGVIVLPKEAWRFAMFRARAEAWRYVVNLGLSQLYLALKHLQAVSDLGPDEAWLLAIAQF